MGDFPGGWGTQVKKSARGVPLSRVVFTGYLPSLRMSFSPHAVSNGIFYMVRSVLFYLYWFRSYTIFLIMKVNEQNMHFL
jgi:hypothetical protein